MTRSPFTESTINADGGKTYARRWESFDAAVAWLDSTAKTSAFIGESSRKTNDPEWSGSKTWAEAVGLSRDGWADVAPRVAAIVDPIRDRLRARLGTAPEMIHDVLGVHVDMGAFMAGEPECMTYTVPEPERHGGKVIRLAVNMATSWMTETDDMIRRGAAVLALIDAIESLGGSVMVTVYNYLGSASSRTPKHAMIDSFTVKNESQHVDRDRVMFALAHPSMFRRVGFAGCERLPEDVNHRMGFDGKHNYGKIRKSMPEAVADTIGGVDLNIARPADADDPAVKDPEAWVIDTLRGLGFDVD